MALRRGVIIRSRSRYRDWPTWWRISGQSGPAPAAGLLVESRALALDAALAGVGIAMMDMAYARPHLEEGRLCLLGRPVELADGYGRVPRG